MSDIHIPSCPRCGDPVTSGCYPGAGICQGVRVASRRALRLAARQRANARLCGLPLTEYLALSRRERKRRVRRARDDGGWHWQRTPDGGWYSGPPLPDPKGADRA